MKTLTLIFIIIYAYPFGFFLGSFVLRRILIYIDESNRERLGGAGINFSNVGFWIGACEHFLTVSFILFDQYTALAIIVAARAFRIEELKRDKNNLSQKSSYYLLGMLLSISFGTFFALTSKIIISYFGLELALP